jgi:hypothetical protein
MSFRAFLGPRVERLRERLRRFERLSPLQLRTIISIWAYVLILSLMNKAASYRISHEDQAKSLVTLLGILSAIPTLAIIAVLGRYLVRETDEFIRMLVVKALLWGAAVAVVAATIQSALAQWSTEWTLTPVETSIMNVDLFVAVAMIVLCVQFWRNR